MLIDWFTVGAQLLNFLILVWLMRRFLYRPILAAVKEREKRISAQLADADSKRSEAQHEREEYQKKNDALEQQRAQLLQKATDDAEAERKRLLDSARQAANEVAEKRKQSLRTEATSLTRTLAQSTQRQVFAISRKVLEDMSSTSLEDRFADVFMRRLRELDEKQKALLTAALNSASEPALVRSTFALSETQRAAIQKAVHESLSTQAELRFDVAPELVCGIELTTHGRKVSWSIADYLTELSDAVSNLVSEPTKAQAKAVPDATPSRTPPVAAASRQEAHGS